MGCETSDSVIISDNENNRKKQARKDNGPDPKYPDMEEWEGDRYKGIGIKRMKGYKCTLPIDKLNEMREKFWSEKIEEDENWRIIQQICVFDEERANLTLGRYNFEVAEDCINHIIGSDGEHYYVPNYCINDPYFEKGLSVRVDKEKKINLILYEVATNSEIKHQFSTYDKGETIKNVIRKELKIGDDYGIRLFFSGMEIKDNEFIYQHDLENDYKILVMRFKLPI